MCSSDLHWHVQPLTLPMGWLTVVCDTNGCGVGIHDRSLGLIAAAARGDLEAALPAEAALTPVFWAGPEPGSAWRALAMPSSCLKTQIFCISGARSLCFSRIHPAPMAAARALPPHAAAWTRQPKRQQAAAAQALGLQIGRAHV